MRRLFSPLPPSARVDRTRRGRTTAGAPPLRLALRALCAALATAGLALLVAPVAAMTGEPARPYALQPDLPQLTTRLGGILAGSGAWERWKASFLDSSGRVVDTGNKGVSHSEGQGYGLLLAVAADDRAAFDAIRGWTREHLGPRADGLHTWRWSPDPGAVPDRNNATDGDILIAWALAEAADNWNDARLRDEAAGIAEAVGRRLVLPVPGYGPVLLPGLYGFDRDTAVDGPIVNLSYWLFPAFGRLSQLAPDTDWAAVARTGLRLIEAAGAGGRPPADWLSLAGKNPQPAQRYPARFSYDALRIPLYLSLAGGSATPDRLRLFPTARTGIPLISVADGSTTEVAQGDGYSAIAGLVRCAVERAPYPRALAAPSTSDAYYPATLRLLAQVAALADPRSCLEPAGEASLRPVAWTSRAPRLPATAVTPVAVAAVEPEAMRRVARTSLTGSAAAGEDVPVLANPLLIVAAPLCVGVGLSGLAFVRWRRRSRSLDVADLTGFPPVPHTPLRPSRAAPTPLPAQLAARSPVALPASRPSPVPVQTLAVPRPATLREIAKPESLPADADGSLETHIRIAANVSAQYRQHVGVMVFAHCGRAKNAAADMSRALPVIRRVLRSADRVDAIAPTEIGVCVALLRDEAQLGIAAARVRQALADEFARDAGDGQPAEPPFTSMRSLVPMDPVARGDLLASLRMQGAEDAILAPSAAVLTAADGDIETSSRTSRGRKRKPATAEAGRALRSASDIDASATPAPSQTQREKDATRPKRRKAAVKTQPLASRRAAGDVHQC